MSTVRLGIYGGTFDPPHIGHVGAARDFIREMRLDRLLIIPTCIPPHKACDADVTPGERLNMCNLAFGDIPGVTVSDMELSRGGKSYTSDTLTELSGGGTGRIFMLIGTDMFLTLESWHCPEVIFRLSHICLARRENDEALRQAVEKKIRLYTEKYGAEITVLDREATELSSSDIRAAISRGDVPCGLVPGRVLDYINKQGLYK